MGTCKSCNNEAEVDFCWYCQLWELRARNNRKSNQVRVDGKLYIILSDTRKTRLSGKAELYAHHIEFKNKKKVFTTHLAYCGVIPAFFMSRLPDNAKFISLPEMHTRRHE